MRRALLHGEKLGHAPRVIRVKIDRNFRVRLSSEVNHDRRVNLRDTGAYAINVLTIRDPKSSRGRDVVGLVRIRRPHGHRLD